MHPPLNVALAIGWLVDIDSVPSTNIPDCSGFGFGRTEVAKTLLPESYAVNVVVQTEFESMERW
jgi:hypothetical protein